MWPFDQAVMRRDVYAMRDRGELSAQEIIDLFCRSPAVEPVTVEVGGSVVSVVPAVPGSPNVGR